MGQLLSMDHVIATYKDPSSMPDIFLPSKFDPNLGFSEPRNVRPLPPVTYEEMEAAGLTILERDYCAHYKMALKKCISENGFISSLACRDTKHSYMECEREDQVLRMKEYERERRLLARERRKMGLNTA